MNNWLVFVSSLTVAAFSVPVRNTQQPDSKLSEHQDVQCFFSPVRSVQKMFYNHERRARCKLRTSSFTMSLIKSLNICLTAFDVHQAQGGKVAHSQEWWGCFKSLLGAPQRNWRGSKLKATGVLYQTCPFRHSALMLFITFSFRIFLCFIFFYCSTN